MKSLEIFSNFVPVGVFVESTSKRSFEACSFGESYYFSSSQTGLIHNHVHK